MGVFEFVLIMVVGLALIKAGTQIMVPVAKRLADLIGEDARERRARRDGQEGAPLPATVVDELEARLARIEDRLDFLEELRAPPRRRPLAPGHDGPPDTR